MSQMHLIDSHFGRANLIAAALSVIRACFEDSTEQAGRLWPAGHCVRHERLKAVRLTISVLLRRLDLETLCVGHWSTKGDFIPLDMATIAGEAGLGRRRNGPYHISKKSALSRFSHPNIIVILSHMPDCGWSER